MSRKIASLLAAIALSAACAGVASADPASRTTSERVSYGDLNLSSPAGARILKTRLNAALDRVCGNPFDSASLTIRRLTKACRQSAMDQAMASINAPLLTAQYVTVETPLRR